MRTAIDMTGQVFGDWTVLKKAGARAGNQRWYCRCVCGATKEIAGLKLRQGKTLGCGCRMGERVAAARMTHGHGGSREESPSRTYIAWNHAKARCFNPSSDSWQYYGGRGITMCDRWKNSFAAFLRDMGECPDGLTLDRIDPNGNYEPGNCRWATWEEQFGNRRRRGSKPVH